MRTLKAVLLGCLLVIFQLSLYATTGTKESTKQYIKASTITADIKSRLLADPDISSLHITVKTVKGTVFLKGYVDNEDQKTKVVEIAKEVKGVQDVRDHLRIRHTD